MFRSIVVLQLTLVACGMLHCRPTAAQDPSEAGSVEKLAAMLQSIDPYRPTADIAGKVKVFGSTAMDAMAHGWAKGFKDFHKTAEVEVYAASPDETFQKMIENPGSIAMFSRPVKDEELEALKAKGIKNPTAFVVAREALGVFVNKTNPVSTISGEQLRAIFTAGGASEADLKWNILGATDSWASQPIHVISRTENSGTQKFLADFVFCDCSLREGLSSHVSNSDVLKAVSIDPLSIAICGLRSTGPAVKPLQLTAGTSVVPSDDHAVFSGDYPLTRPLTLVIDMDANSPNAKAAQEFVHYALCQAGQAQAILVGFFPVDLPLLRAGLQKLGSTKFR